MDSPTQPDQTAPHIEQLALAELDVANRQLADAGRTIDGLRSDALALASRVDSARAEAESFRDQLERGRSEIVEDQERLASSAAKEDELNATISTLEAHVARLKQQLKQPGRLVVKKALRRGQYAKPDNS